MTADSITVIIVNEVKVTIFKDSSGNRFVNHLYNDISLQKFQKIKSSHYGAFTLINSISVVGVSFYILKLFQLLILNYKLELIHRFVDWGLISIIFLMVLRIILLSKLPMVKIAHNEFVIDVVSTNVVETYFILTSVSIGVSAFILFKYFYSDNIVFFIACLSIVILVILFAAWRSHCVIKNFKSKSH